MLIKVRLKNKGRIQNQGHLLGCPVFYIQKRNVLQSNYEC